jgi:hypothetical protein
MSRLKDLTGLKFGDLTVVSLSEISRNKHSRWNVKCSCGVEKTVLGTHLIQNKTKSCGCIKSREPRNFKGVGKLSKTYYSSLKRGANGGKGRKPIEFNISMEYLWKIYEIQKGLCAYSKLPIDFKSKTASCDRIDSSKGYIKGNIQWLHKDINMMKRHYKHDYFLHLCGLITKNN